jgi:hypothetical protein
MRTPELSSLSDRCPGCGRKWLGPASRFDFAEGVSHRIACTWIKAFRGKWDAFFARGYLAPRAGDTKYRGA